MTNQKMLELLKAKKYEELKNGLIENIRVETEKGKGVKSSDLTIIKRINCLENLYGNHKINFGKVYNGFTEGHYILADCTTDFGYEESKNKINMDKFFNSDGFSGIELKIDLKDVALFKKLHGKERKAYVIENEKIRIGFNPSFLLDTLNFCKTDTIYVHNPKAPAYIKSENMDRVGLVLPINLAYQKN